MQHFFRENEVPYNLKKGTVLFLPPASSKTQTKNSIHFRDTLIYNQLPSSIKFSKPVTEFKANLNLLENIDCGCVISRK